MSFKRRAPKYESNSGVEHPEFEKRNTRVSEYLRKYGQGKIDTLPTDTRSEVKDERSVDEMLEVDDVTNRMDTEQLDALLEMQAKADDFEAAFKDIELTKTQKQQFDKAVSVLKDKNASYELVSDAYRILEELENKHKVTRARK